MHLLGLRGVSQVWSPQPAWYFWIHKAVGPYHLRLESAKTLCASSGSLLQAGLFSLRCYPYPDNPGMAVFSEEEHCLVAGDSFDETHTPKFEHLDGIPLHLFQVAAVEYIVGPNDSWELIAVENVRRATVPIAEYAVKPCEHCGQSEEAHGETSGRVVQADATSPLPGHVHLPSDSLDQTQASAHSSPSCNRAGKHGSRAHRMSMLPE